MSFTLGALAHVDAGKTSLAESILFYTQTIRNKGKIDDKNTFLDFDDLEKEKGITIYNCQANFKYKNKEYTYLDTPGHNELAYETSRALNIIDGAIIILSSIEDIPLDTINKFNNLLNYHIPILFFVNKMDISNFTKEEILKKIQNKLNPNIYEVKDLEQELALIKENLLDKYLNNKHLEDEDIKQGLIDHKIFPCFFGSALKNEGIQELLDFVDIYLENHYDSSLPLNAYLYKIDQEYSYLKILSGTLKTKDNLGEDKIHEIYEVNGHNYKPINEAKASNLVAVKGLKDIEIGTYLPSLENDIDKNYLALTYEVISNLDNNDLYKKLNSISNEFPELNIRQESNKVYLNLTGELQALIVKNNIKKLLNIDIKFSDPLIKYQETIKNETYGVGHYEPLRHYGEVLLSLKPLKKGLNVHSKLDSNYLQTLISYLYNYPLKGILTNSPLTNVDIEILAIKTHPKHTEGQDLINALKRALRQALSKNECLLLEPYYLINIETDINNMNDIINFLTNKNLTFSIEEKQIIVKISQLIFNDCILQLRSRLKGNLNYSLIDTIYDECLNQEDIIKQKNYDYLLDKYNPAGSIFCKAGAGHYVPPQEVEALMHINLKDYINNENETKYSHQKYQINEAELQRVWNNLYKPRLYLNNQNKTINKERNFAPSYNKPLIYLIDGYNLMYFVYGEIAYNDLLSARLKTIDLVSDFSGYVKAEIILVFDAYKTELTSSEIQDNGPITIIYTKANQTADNFIELKSKELKNDFKVNVVTSDNLEQLRVYANNASVISSREFINRYHNLQKNNTYSNKQLTNRPLSKLRQLLSD